MPISSNRCAVCPAREVGPCIDHDKDHRRLMFIGEGPGIKDRHMPYSGWAGKEFNFNLLPTYLYSTRDQIWFSNVVKCAEARDERKKKIDDAIIDGCSRHWIDRELSQCDPEVVVVMGGPALKIWRQLDGSPFDVDMHHGFPYKALRSTVDGRILNKTPYTIFPTIHPSLGMHQTSALKHIYDDFLALRVFLRTGEWTAPTDEFEGREDYREVFTEDQLLNYIGNADQVALDTETQQNKTGIKGKKVPWSIQVSVRPGTAVFIDTSNRPLVKALHKRLQSILVWMHNDIFDLDVCESAGVYINRWVDTMVQAYTLQLQYKSLKWLGYRLCGMRMVEYEDVIKPYIQKDTLDWFQRAVKHKPPLPGEKKKDKEARLKFEAEYLAEHGKPYPYFSTPSPIKNFDGSFTKPHGIGTKISTALTNYYKDNETDLRDRFSNWSDDERYEIQSIVGELPPGDLSRVPRWRAIEYACKDADATIRIAPILRRMQIQLGKSIRREYVNDMAIEGADYGWLYESRVG